MTTTLDVRDLLEHPGSSRKVHVAKEFEDLGTELVRVPADAPVRLDILLESVVEGILVSGPVSGRMTMSCARCLRPFTQEFEFDVTELYAPGAKIEDDEYPLAEDGAIDLEPLVRDTVLLAMPFSPLCRPDCKGLCERCGGDRNLGECSCPPPTDARWAGLSDLNLDID